MMFGNGCVFVALILSVSGILGQTTHMCVLKGSTVDLPCPGNSPDGQSPRRIDEVKESDANIYQCSADTSALSLSVTDLQVKVILGPLRERQGVIFNCSTSCPLTDSHTYMWYKNGQFLYEDSSPWYQLLDNSEEEAIYSCAVKGHEALKAPNVTVNSVNPSCFRMTYADGSITYFRDLHVEVKTVANKVQLTCSTSCTLTHPIPTFYWNSNRYYVSGITSQLHTVDRTSDQHNYFCDVKDQKDLRSPSVCVQGESCWRVNYMKQRICALIGSSVDISCNYSYPTGHEVIDTYWYTTWKHEEKPQKLTEVPNYEHRVAFSGQTKNHHILTIKNLTVNDSAEYIFRIHTNQRGGRYGASPGVTLYVTDLKLKMIPAADATEGQRVTLVCSSSCPLTDNPTYMWYQNRQVVTQKQSQQNYVVLDPVSSQNAGEYSCAVKGQEELRSPEETLTVTSQSSSVKNAAIGITVVCLSLVFLACLWKRKKKTQNSSTDPAQSGQTKSDHMYDNISAVSRTLVTAPHGEPTEPQDELHYSSVHLPHSTNHEVSLYSTTQPPQTQEDVQYEAINFNTCSKPQVQAAAEDTSELYSTVNIPNRV